MSEVPLNVPTILTWTACPVCLSTGAKKGPPYRNLAFVRELSRMRPKTCTSNLFYSALALQRYLARKKHPKN